MIYSDVDGKIVFNYGSVIYCYMNISGDNGADADNVKRAGAIVYTSANEYEANVYDDRIVAVENGIIDIAECKNHDDYDTIYKVNGIYLVCKCCGGYSKITTSDGIVSVESSNGISGANAFDHPLIASHPDTFGDTVTEITIEFSGMDIVDGTLSLNEGDSGTLTLNAIANAEFSDIIWECADTSVATIGKTSGEILAVGAGSTMLTVSAAVGDVEYSNRITVVVTGYYFDDGAYFCYGDKSGGANERFDGR